MTVIITIEEIKTLVCNDLAKRGIEVNEEDLSIEHDNYGEISGMRFEHSYGIIKT